MSARVLVVQHETICPPARLGQWLAAAGLTVELIRPYAGEKLPEELSHDGLIVLGGTMGAGDDDIAAWLPATRRLLADAVRDRVPTLGVCLGHQLLAVACGGRVQRNVHGATIGLRPVKIADPSGGPADPLVADLPASAVAIHWNDDVITRPPPGVSVLATTEDGSPQVIRVGERAWGVQFHPEADSAIASVWADRTVTDGELSRSVAERHLAEIAGADLELTSTWRPWAERFAAVVLS